MDIDATVQVINDLREAFFDALDGLGEVSSFQTLRSTCRPVGEATQIMEKVRDIRILQQPCDGKVHCALIGNSSAGKTTLLRELFPDLDRRGWLRADITDTTSQALAISSAQGLAGTEAERVVVESWSLDQIKRLMEHKEVKEQNAKSQIDVEYGKEAVHVDGSRSVPTGTGDFRFPVRMSLVPFPQPYEPSPEQADDERFRSALTTKQLSDQLVKAPVLHVGSQSYNSLQLRAVVRRVALHDPFERLAVLSGESLSTVSRLTLIDTPGLATAGSEKDEVLRHYLARKSAHILSELWKEDELDVVVHIVMCGDQTTFSELLKYVEHECSSQIFDDLAERLVLVINGTNQFFEVKDLRRRFEEPVNATDQGDHFAVALVDNVLEKMSPRASLKPTQICFVDSRRHVENLRAVDSYADYYGQRRERMDSWTRPGGIGYETLRKLGLTESFRDNVAALVNPDDCGQGYLVRQLRKLIDDRGWVLLVRRYLIRSGLLQASGRLRELLRTYYDDTGHLTQRAVREALRSCLSFDSRKDPQSIERFVEQHRLDEVLDAAIPTEIPAAEAEGWVGRAFASATAIVKKAILGTSSPLPEVAGELSRYLDVRAVDWAKDWGYTTTELGPPQPTNPRLRQLLLHSLRLHIREMLYQLELEAAGRDDAPGFREDEGDCERIGALREALEQALKPAEALWQRGGV